MTPIGGPGERLRLAGVALLVVTFAVGGLAGAAVKSVFDGEGSAQSAEQRDRRRDDDDRDRGRHGYPYEALGTTPEQQAAIEAALEGRRERLEALWAEYRPRMEAQMDSTRTEIRGILTAEQQARMDSLREARKQRSRAEREPTGESK
jgi:Spy/CpxP family protein refolding chaperone